MNKRITAAVTAFLFLLNIVPSMVINGIASENTVLISDNNVKLSERNISVYDLKKVCQVTDISVYQSNSEKSSIKSIDIYLSADGNNFGLFDTVLNTDTITLGETKISYSFDQIIYASHIKLNVTVKEGKECADINKIEIKGSTEVKEEPIDKSAISYEWLDDQPFVTGYDVISEDSADKKMLLDNNKTDALKTENEYACAVFDLNTSYQIGEVNVWSAVSEGTFMDGYELKYSLDGEKYFSYGFFANPADRNTEAVTPTASCGIPGKNARYLKIVMHTPSKMEISEVDINLYRADAKPPKSTSVPDLVLPYISTKCYTVAYIDWSSYNSKANEVSKYSVYVEKNDFTNIAGKKPVGTFDGLTLEGKSKFYIHSPLEPETTYFAAVTPVDKNGKERTDVKTVEFTTPKVLGEKPSDIFCINYAADEIGASDVKHGKYQEDNLNNVLKLLDEMGTVSKCRWFSNRPDVIKRFAKIGIGFNSLCGLINWGKTTATKNLNAVGLWEWGTANERDLLGQDVKEYMNWMYNRNYALSKLYDNRNILCEPVLGGSDPSCLDWLDRLYSADCSNGEIIKTYFEALDFHAYCKTTDKQLPGIPVSSPEILPMKLDKIREVMEKHGDVNKPIITTEIGWSTFDGKRYLPGVDRQTQANYLARMYITAIASGMKEAFWYNYQDNGLNPKDFEQNWGWLDWFGVPKPSYYSAYRLSSLIKNTQYVGKMSEVMHPYYGYTFWDEQRNKYMSAIWAADNLVKTADIDVDSDEKYLTVYDSNSCYRIIPVINGKATVTISGSPVYVYSSNKVKVSSVQTTFEIDKTELSIGKDEDFTILVKRTEQGIGLYGKVEVDLPKGWSLNSPVAFDANTDSIPVIIHTAYNSPEEVHPLDLRLAFQDGTVLPFRLAVTINPSIEVAITPEIGDSGNLNDWNIAVYVTNLLNKPTNGKIEIGKAEFVNISGSTIEFENLQPNEKRRFVFPLVSVPKVFGAKVVFDVTAFGLVNQYERKMNFTAAVNDGIKPSIDGIISEGEWDNTMVAVQNDLTIVPDIKNWGGLEDHSFKIYRKWDNDNFYMAIDVTDDVHWQEEKGTGIWKGDGVQFTFDAERNNGIGNSKYFEVGIALNNDGNQIAWKYLDPLESKQEKGWLNQTSKIVRSGNHTVYEIAIPWSEFILTRTPQQKDIYGFAAVVNNNDGTGRGFNVFMGGIARTKNSQEFEDMILIKK